MPCRSPGNSTPRPPCRWCRTRRRPGPVARCTGRLPSGSLRRSCADFRCAGEFLDHHLAHREFLDLAGYRGRETLDDPDVARDLVMRDAVLAENAYALRIERGACLGDDPGAEFLAVLRVGHAEYLDILDFWVPVEILLDLARIDVLTAADHHV